MSNLDTGASGNIGVAFPLQQPVDTFGGRFGDRKGTRTFLVDYDGTNDNWLTYVPDVGTPHPAFPSILFDDFDMKQDAKQPGVAKLTLKYEEEDFSGGGTLPDLPDDEYVEDGGILEIDIVRFNKFTTPNPSWTASGGDQLSLSDFYNPREQRIFMNDVIPAEFIDEDGNTKAHPYAGEAIPEEIRGMSKFVAGTGTVTETVYSYNEPAAVIQNGGKRATPTGYADPSGDTTSWLVMSAIKQKSGGFWQVVTVYQLSSRTVSDWVYDSL